MCIYIPNITSMCVKMVKGIGAKYLYIQVNVICLKMEVVYIKDKTRTLTRLPCR